MSRITDALKKAQADANRVRASWKTPPLPQIPQNIQALRPSRTVMIIGLSIAFAAGVGIGLWSSRGRWQGRGLYVSGTKLLKKGETQEGRQRLEQLASEYPYSRWADDALFNLGRSQQETGEIEEARINYEGLLALYPHSPLADQTKEELKQLLGQPAIVKKPEPKPAKTEQATEPQPEQAQPQPAQAEVQQPAGTTVYEVQSGDTLGKIARRFGITIEDIQHANNLNGTMIRARQQLNIPAKASSATQEQPAANDS